MQQRIHRSDLDDADGCAEHHRTRTSHIEMPMSRVPTLVQFVMDWRRAVALAGRWLPNARGSAPSRGTAPRPTRSRRRPAVALHRTAFVAPHALSPWPLLPRPPPPSRRRQPVTALSPLPILPPAASASARRNVRRRGGKGSRGGSSAVHSRVPLLLSFVALSQRHSGRCDTRSSGSRCGAREDEHGKEMGGGCPMRIALCIHRARSRCLLSSPLLSSPFLSSPLLPSVQCVERQRRWTTEGSRHGVHRRPLRACSTSRAPALDNHAASMVRQDGVTATHTRSEALDGHTVALLQD
jgi:hypothetical protein